MPELVEQMYCSQQIVVPPKFPYILKRFCKAAIKTQPYDLLRWSFEYFKSLANHKPPPVKLRLEYPVFATEGGLTRGCLKVLAHQLADMAVIPLQRVKAAWGGFCLDPNELKRILCLCEVHMRADEVPFLHFIAVAGGLLTKSLTHTMILLCEILTAEPDGGSASIPVNNFMLMYKLLAGMDASRDICYYDGYREGEHPEEEPSTEEDNAEAPVSVNSEPSYDEFWGSASDGPLHLRKLSLIDDNIAGNPKLSTKLQETVLGKLERSPSIERMMQIERENYTMAFKADSTTRNEGMDRMLKEISSAKLNTLNADSSKEVDGIKEEARPLTREVKGGDPSVRVLAQAPGEICDIVVYNEEDVEIAYEFYGEPEKFQLKDEIKQDEGVIEDKGEKIDETIANLYQIRADRLNDLENTFNEITQIVDKFKTAHYDLGMVAGRQMSTTSGEFIVGHIEREILAYIDEQIAILPDPDLKKKKAKPEEVAMIRELLETFIDENMDVICPEIEEVEEEEAPIPTVVVVYAVPGIGPPVDVDIMKEFEDYVREAVKVQADVFMPRNIRHFLCPPLEKYIEYDYGYQTSTKKREETPPAPGPITD